MNIKKNDTVIVLSGKDKGVKGKVLVAMPAENKVIVEKVNVATCHTKPRKQGEQGGIVKKETPIRSCKVALYCDKCGKGVRVGYKVVESAVAKLREKYGYATLQRGVVMEDEKLNGLDIRARKDD